MTETQRVGLFGGSFNPPHICHLLASLYLLETTDLDAVWWVPVHRHAFAKDRTLACWDHRLALCEAVAAEHPRIRVETIERSLGVTSYTFDTVTALRGRHPHIDFSWVIGTDLLADLHAWHRWPELRNILRFIVLGRGAPVSPSALPDGGRFILRDFHLPDISSSAVRAALRAHAPIDAMVPAAVRAYLAEHPDLYRP